MSAVSLASVPAVLALVNLAKGLGVPSKFSPLLAIILGVICSILVAAAEHTGLTEAALAGIVLGLGASGLYDATQNESEAQ